MSDLIEIKLRKGTIINIMGLPFFTKEEITVLGTEENKKIIDKEVNGKGE